MSFLALVEIKHVWKLKNIIVIFQPHRYSRIKNLKREFTFSFSKSNKVILCPVYSAGEKKDKIYIDDVRKEKREIKKQISVPMPEHMSNKINRNVSEQLPEEPENYNRNGLQNWE